MGWFPAGCWLVPAPLWAPQGAPPQSLAELEVSRTGSLCSTERTGNQRVRREENLQDMAGSQVHTLKKLFSCIFLPVPGPFEKPDRGPQKKNGGRPYSLTCLFSFLHPPLAPVHRNEIQGNQGSFQVRSPRLPTFAVDLFGRK